MAGEVVERLVRADLDDLAEIHHRHAIAHVAHHRQVVGDEHDRQAEPPLQVAQQVQHLRLDRDVERRHRLVGDQQLRVQRERARHADALALAAGELVRVAVVVLGVQPDRLHQPLHLALALVLVRQQAVDRERLGDDRADRLARVQRRVRVLEDHLHLAPDRLQARALQARDVAALEVDLAGGGLEQAHHQLRGRALAATGLAHDAPASRRARCSKLTPSTALTAPILRWKMIPRVIGKCLTRSAHPHERRQLRRRAHAELTRALPAGRPRRAPPRASCRRRSCPHRRRRTSDSSRHAT